MTLAKPLTAIFQYIEQNEEKFFDRLKNAIAIQSCPSSEKNNSILDMINWTNELLKSFEVKTELRNIQDESYRGPIPLPPVLLGNLETGICPNKATVLIYGHLDVKSARKGDGWHHEPFELIKEDGFFYGRGLSDKCSLVAWLNAVEAFYSSGIDFPVNIKFVFESLGTQCSRGLKNLLISEKDKFLAHIDYICVSKGCWLQPEIPNIIKSSKGICTFLIEIQSAVKNLDSDICGGMVQEAMIDLIFILRSLTDEKGNLDISSMQLEVEPIPDEDLQIYKNANFNVKKFLNSLGAHCSSHTGDKFEILKHRLSLPTITIHDIKCSCFKQAESEIPGSVSVKVSIRTAHSQTSEKVFRTIKNYLQKVWLNYGSCNRMKITLERSLDGWHTDVEHDHFQVGVKAFNYVYELDPWYSNSGYIIPALNILSLVFERNVIVLPVGCGENYDINENFKCSNYYNAAKVFSAYLYEMGELPRLLNRSSSSFTSCISCPSLAEACVCGRFGEKIKAASGDAEKCACTDLFCQPKPTEFVQDKLDAGSAEVTVETKNVENPLINVVEILKQGEQVELPSLLLSTEKDKDPVIHAIEEKEQLIELIPSASPAENEENDIIDVNVPEEGNRVERPLCLLLKDCKCPLEKRQQVVLSSPLLSTKNEEKDSVIHAIEEKEQLIKLTPPASPAENEEHDIIDVDVPDEGNKVERPISLHLKDCKCPLTPAENFPKDPVGEMMSIISNASALSRDPTPILEPEKPKKDLTPSAETLKCVCTPKMYRNVFPQRPLTPERQEELMKSMRSFGSKPSGISAGESQPNIKTTRMNNLGCVCPEKSTETVFEETRQIERMLCPVKDTKKEQQCTKGGKRKHHIIGPAPLDEDDSDISVGPLSHCSCSTEELVVVQSCDCDTKSRNPAIPKEINDPLFENLEDELD